MREKVSSEAMTREKHLVRCQKPVFSLPMPQRGRGCEASLDSFLPNSSLI